MAKKATRKTGHRKRKTRITASDYRHSGEKRDNIPPAKIAAEGTIPRVPHVRYHYSPHLPPDLRFDSTGAADSLPGIIAEAGHRSLTESEQKRLVEALSSHQPWLEWASKKEQYDRGFFEINPVALHIHERVSSKAVVRCAMRDDVQRDLFADPELPYSKQIQFYRHEMGWVNRLILGDSLQVMVLLARREGLAGKVQMVYMDPPYGINYSSNFQPEVAKIKVKERDADLIREAESVKAFRDTWTLGTHSYLQYLNTRFRIVRELLSESASLFVQISDGQSYRVRQVLDEVFGPHNFVAQINFRSMMPLSSGDIESVYDYVLWYAKDRRQMKYRNLFVPKEIGQESEFSFREDDTGQYLLRSQSSGWDPRSPGVFKRSNLSSSGYTESCTFDIDFEGQVYEPVQGKSWRTTPEGVSRLKSADRVFRLGKKLYFRLFLQDFTHGPLVNSWHDTIPFDRKLYVVRTTPTVVRRCMLMTTDPGDLVVDPTCGSGTSAYVAERWGRRWITIDTSRVSVSIARQRLLTAKYDFYRTQERDTAGDQLPSSGFVHKTVPHITLRSIAQNSNLDPIFTKYTPLLDDALRACNEALSEVDDKLRDELRQKLLAKQRKEGKRRVTEADRRRWLLPPGNRASTAMTVDRDLAAWYQWEVPLDLDAQWPQSLQDSVKEYRRIWRLKRDEVNSCIADNADFEELVDEPEVVPDVVRVSGSFTVEGVRPEELSLGDDGAFDPTPNDLESEHGSSDTDARNAQTYLAQMVKCLRADGLTYLNNTYRGFSRLEPLFEDFSGSLLHAEGSWDDDKDAGSNPVAVTFGPRHGPVTALQVEEAIREARRYDELVVAGFSFDAEAHAVVEEQSHPKLRLHVAQIRPDLNQAMDGLLKDTPNSQLFSVFGQPDVDVKERSQAHS